MIPPPPMPPGLPAEAVRAALAACPLFEGIDDVGPVEAAGEAIEIPDGSTLMAQGEAGDRCYVVLEGRAAVIIDGQQWGDVGPGECVGEMALLDSGPRSATVTATTPMVVFALGAEAFSDLLDRMPILRDRLTAGLVRRLRASDGRWGRVAADPELLFKALLRLQSSPDPEVARKAQEQAAALVRRAAAASPPAPTGATPDPLKVLTTGERRVVDLVAEGLSNGAIAERLYVSRYTVESHLKHVFTKLALRSRVELAALALRPRT